MKNQPWIYSSVADTLFVLMPPLATLLVIALLPTSYVNGEVSPAAWLLLVIMVDVAHVYSSVYRTYFDPETMAKHRTLLTTVPFVVFIVGVIFYSLNAMLFWRMLAYVAVFHFIRQQYGFLRIYARKENSTPIGAIIDKLTIYSATIYPILYWHTHPEKEFNWFVDGDFIYFNAPVVSTVFSIVYAAILIAYGIKEVTIYIKNKQLNIPKNLLVIGTSLSWYFGIVYYNGDLAFTALNVLSHGIPYMALIWFYGRKKYKENAPKSLSALFKPFAIPLFLGIVIILAYFEEGLWDALVWADHKSLFSVFSFLPHINSDRLLAIVVPLLTVPQFTHYVIDGFIWKIGNDKYNWKDVTLGKQ